MEDLFLYFLKSSSLLVAFYLAYYFLLRKETFFNSNRWFLLFGLGTSALLPLFFIKKIVFVESPKFNPNTIMTVSNNATSNLKEISPESATIDWFQLIALGYILIVLILFIKVLINLFSLSKIVLNKPIEKQERFNFIDLKEDIAPFSFFNYIVFNSSLYSESELQSILLHEKIHSAQKHTLDVLITNLFSVIFWFNPFIYWYKKAIIQNLEYIADHKAIQNIEDKKSYQKALLKVVTHQNCLPITNHFYQSLIKKRIVMLNKNQSNKRNSWKYAVIIPALVAFVFVFQIKLVAQEKAEKNSLKEEKVKAICVGYETDKNATNEEMKNDTKLAKEQLGIDYKFSNVKRNDKGEIIAIKIEYKTKEGKSGKIELDSNNPIETIYFNAEEDKVGFSKNDFLSSSDENNTTVEINYKDAINLVKQNNDERTNAFAIPNNNKISFITKNENNDDDVVIRQPNFTGIKVPGEPTLNLNTKPIIVLDGSIVEGDTDKIINMINPNTIESMNVIKGENAIKNYGEKGKNGVIEIYAKVKNKSTYTPDSITDSDFLSIVLNSSEPDAGWYSLTNYFKKQNIITEISNIKRNKDNKIIAITIAMKSSDGRVQKLIIEKNTPIKSIEIFVDKTKNKNWNFGVKELDLEYKSDLDSSKKDAIQARKDAIQARKDATQARKDATQAKNDLKIKR